MGWHGMPFPTMLECITWICFSCQEPEVNTKQTKKSGMKGESVSPTGACVAWASISAPYALRPNEQPPPASNKLEPAVHHGASAARGARPTGARGTQCGCTACDSRMARPPPAWGLLISCSCALQACAELILQHQPASLHNLQQGKATLLLMQP